MLPVMADVLTKAQRSYNMSRIRGKNTGPETTIRHGLRLEGLRNYRVNSGLLGRPDIVFPKRRLAVFVDGCFWHGCPAHYHPPATRSKFWAEKIERNISRDKIVEKTLKQDGWQVLRVWEHDVRDNPSRVVDSIRSRLASGGIKPSRSRT